MSKKITATVANTEDEKIRLSLGDALKNKYGRQVAEPQWATGVSLDAVYVGHKWFVIETDSSWQDRQGRRTGTQFTAYDMTSTVDHQNILRICEKLDIEPPSAIEAQAA